LPHVIWLKGRAAVSVLPFFTFFFRKEPMPKANVEQSPPDTCRQAYKVPKNHGTKAGDNVLFVAFGQQVIASWTLRIRSG